jgi:hypothetical protein
VPLLLVPVFSMAFMQACVQIESGKRVYPNLLLTGFKSPRFSGLIRLGVLYVLSAVIALGVSAIADGGVFWNVMTGSAPIDAKTVQESRMTLGMLVAVAVWTPAAMAFWFAAPLIAWQDMPVGKSLFYSFFAVRRAGKAFLVYGLAWVIIGVFLPVMLSSALALITGKMIVTMLVLMPVSIIMTVAMYCSFFPNYTDVFGQPESAPLAPPPAQH